MKIVDKRALVSLAVVLLLVMNAPAADHSWSTYHWRSSGGISLDVGNNLSGVWQPYLTQAIADWNQSSYVDLFDVAGGTRPKNCRPTSGRIEVCNASYGNNGWLGIAQIWVSGGHIAQAITKVNDTYFNTATYNTAAWRRLVMCQEIAHDFGLDHQDETFNNPNLGSCMDYTNDPDGPPSNEHPNKHDYDQLASIYSHTDASAGAGVAAIQSESPEHPSQWGRLMRQNDDRRIQVFELDLGNGRKMLTHVYWADPERDARGRER